MGMETISTVGGLVSSGVGMAMSFSEMAKQKDAQNKAEADAAQAMVDARKRLDVNYYDKLAINKEPYELEREALNVSAAQSLSAANEGDQRGIAAAAGRVQMANNVQQGNVRTAEGNDMLNLQKMSAQQDTANNNANVALDQGEIKGAQMAAAQAGQYANQAEQNLITGVTGAIGQAAKLPALFPKTKDTTTTPDNSTWDEQSFTNSLFDPNSYATPNASGQTNQEGIIQAMQNKGIDTTPIAPEILNDPVQLKQYLLQNHPEFVTGLYRNSINQNNTAPNQFDFSGVMSNPNSVVNQY